MKRPVLYRSVIALAACVCAASAADRQDQPAAPAATQPASRPAEQPRPAPKPPAAGAAAVDDLARDVDRQIRLLERSSRSLSGAIRRRGRGDRRSASTGTYVYYRSPGRVGYGLYPSLWAPTYRLGWGVRIGGSFSLCGGRLTGRVRAGSGHRGLRGRGGGRGPYNP